MLIITDTKISASFDLLESSLSISAPAYFYLHQREGIISNQIIAHILFKAFDEYYFSFYTSYGHHIDDRHLNLKDNLHRGYYGLGLEKHLTDDISLSFSYSTEYFSHSSIWDSKYRQDKILDLMLKLIF